VDSLRDDLLQVHVRGDGRIFGIADVLVLFVERPCPIAGLLDDKVFLRDGRDAELAGRERCEMRRAGIASP
jgi:hypothetical protein